MMTTSLVHRDGKFSRKYNSYNNENAFPSRSEESVPSTKRRMSNEYTSSRNSYYPPMQHPSRSNQDPPPDESDCASFLMTLKYRILPNPTADIQKLQRFPLTHNFPNRPRPPLPPALSTHHPPSSSSSSITPINNIYLPLSHPDDSYWLSPLQCYIRATCAELFSATINPDRPNRRHRITPGRVGIRCVYCRDLPPSRRAPQAVSFPSHVGGIYSAVVMMQCRHFSTCHAIPEGVKGRIAELKGDHSRGCKGSNQGRQQYWIDSARKMGLIDSDDGIRFSRDPRAEMAGWNHSTMERREEVEEERAVPLEMGPTSFEVIKDLVGDSTLVVPEDMMLIPDYLFLAMAQLRPCHLSEVDRVGCYKNRKVGFPGMCCKHCGGQPGFGKYFPATVRSLAQTTTSQTIVKHVGSKCRHSPMELRRMIGSMQAASLAHGGNYGRGGNSKETAGKPKYGSRKVFFQRLWGRLHGQEVPPIPESAFLEEEDARSCSGESLESASEEGAETPSMTSNDEDEEDVDVVGHSEEDHGDEEYEGTEETFCYNTTAKRKTKKRKATMMFS